MTTTGFAPRVVTSCGPSERAQRTTSENLAFACCWSHRTRPAVLAGIWSMDCPHRKCWFGPICGPDWFECQTQRLNSPADSTRRLQSAECTDRPGRWCPQEEDPATWETNV